MYVIYSVGGCGLYRNGRRLREYSDAGLSVCFVICYYDDAKEETTIETVRAHAEYIRYDCDFTIF